MKRTPKKSLNRHRCPNACLYFLAEQSDSEYDSQEKYGINIVIAIPV